MKKIIICSYIAVALLFLPNISEAQGDLIFPYVFDTTSIHTRAILNLWQNYRLDILYDEANIDVDLKKHWADEEIKTYAKFDLYRAVSISNLFAWLPCNILGVVKRKENYFELRVEILTDVLSNSSTEADKSDPKYIPYALLNIPVELTSSGYKFHNMLTINKQKMQCFKLGNVNYYHESDYKLDTNAIIESQKRLAYFCQKINLSISLPNIDYFVFENQTKMYKCIGFDYHCYSMANELDRGGTQIYENNMMFYGGDKAESYMHEFIHILLRNIRPAGITWFEEGIACYYGDMLGKSYPFYAQILKEYLISNKSKLEEMLQTNPHNFFDIVISQFNGTYMIMATLVKIAEQQGAVQKIIEMLKICPNNENDFFGFIEHNLYISKEELINELINNIE